MRGQAPLIALMLMIAIVLALGVGLIAFFNIHYSKLSSERAKITSLSGVPASITVIPVYLEETQLVGSTDRIQCYMAEIVNIGSSRITIWITIGGGYMDEMGYPRLVLEHEIVKVVMVEAPGGLLEVPTCPGDPPGLSLVQQTLSASGVYTLDELSLREVGNLIDYNLKGFTRIDLEPGDSRTFYIVASIKGGASSWTLIFLLSYFNEKPYIVGLYKLPS